MASNGCSVSTLAPNHTVTCINSGTQTDAGSATNTLSTVVIKDANGTDATKNYTITKVNGTLTVNPKSIAVTWNSTTTFTYNGSDQGPSLFSTSLTGANSETVYIAVTNNEAKATSVGSYTAKATCVHVSKGQESKSCDNYTLTGNTKAFTINKATPEIKLPTSSGSVTYHTSNGFAGNWVYSPKDVSGTVTLTSSNTNYVSIQENYVSTKVDSSTSQPAPNFTIVVYGVKATLTPIPITVKFTPDNENFETVTETFNVTVNQATPKITLSEESAWLSGSKTFTEKANVAGKFTNTSGTTSVATVSPKSNSTAVAANTAQTVTVTGVADGSSTITVTFEPTDTTNYKTVSAKYTAKVDKTKPTITANGYAYSNNSGSNTSTPYNDTGNAIKSHSSNSDSSDTYNWNKTGINFRIGFSDSASGIQSATWCWDTKYSDTDPGATVFDSASNSDCVDDMRKHKQISLTGEGYRRGRFTVTDKAGNTTIYNVIVKIDKTKPTMTLSVPNGTTLKSSRTATVTLSDAGGSGLTNSPIKIYYKLSTSSVACSDMTQYITITPTSGSSKATGTIKPTISNSNGGNYKLYICNKDSAVSDIAGNSLAKNTLKSADAYMENIKPSIYLTSSPSGTTYSKTKTITVTLRDVGPNDGISGLTNSEVKIYYAWSTSSVACSSMTNVIKITPTDGATEATGKITLSGQTGAGKLYVCNKDSAISDKAGNSIAKSTVSSINAYLDNKAPSFSITNISGVVTYKGKKYACPSKTITFKLKVTDPNLPSSWYNNLSQYISFSSLKTGSLDANFAYPSTETGYGTLDGRIASKNGTGPIKINIKAGAVKDSLGNSSSAITLDTGIIATTNSTICK